MQMASAMLANFFANFYATIGRFDMHRLLIHDNTCIS